MEIYQTKITLHTRIKSDLYLVKNGYVSHLDYFPNDQIKIKKGNIELAIKSTEVCKIYLKSERPFELKKTTQKVGVFNPKIFRPIYKTAELKIFNRRYDKEEVKKSDFIFDYDELTNSLNELKTLINRLNKIILTVYPSENNFEVYGFEIRNLLILACTEFETQIVGILKANDIKPKNNNYSTKDYFLFNSIIKLNEYSIKFKNFPKINVFEPFRDWNENSTTKSIPWYDNYNAVKHDRETNFEKATLESVLNSISACYIILISQYGELDFIKNETNNYFSVIKKPVWNDDEMYIKPLEGEKWEVKKYNG